MLDEDTRIKLVIYNILGEEVDCIAKGIYSQGKHIINFDSNNLGAGTYYCRLESDSFILSNKMVKIENWQ